MGIAAAGPGTPGGGDKFSSSRRRRNLPRPVSSRIVGLAVTLYLIGSTVSRVTLKTVAPRPLLQGALLWIVVAVTSLLMIRRGLIGL